MQGLIELGPRVDLGITLTAMIILLQGATATACCVAALFFLKFWRTTRDRLFFFSLWGSGYWPLTGPCWARSTFVRSTAIFTTCRDSSRSC